MTATCSCGFATAHDQRAVLYDLMRAHEAQVHPERRPPVELDVEPEGEDVCPGCGAPLMLLRSVLGKPYSACFVCCAQGKERWPAESR